MALVVVDIDNCIANGRRRRIAAGAEPDRVAQSTEYETWRDVINQGIEHDEPVAGMPELVRALAAAADVHAIYVTARGSSLRNVTREWLAQHGFPSLMLFMRAEEDRRKSATFKEWLISKQLTAEHEPVVILDDDERGELEEVCARRGWTMLKAVSGGLK